MSRNSTTNLSLALAAAAAWTVVRLATTGGHAAADAAGAGVDDMVRGFTLKGGVEATRLSPLIPMLAWIPYALSGSVGSALTVVNTVAIAVLVFAACVLMDRRSEDVWWKAFVALTIPLCTMFGRQAAFAPASPQLCAAAAVMLGVALASEQRALALASANVAAVMALPIGLVAPLYGAAYGLRRRMAAPRIALAAVPAIAMWLFVQWWGRGGVMGALEDFAPAALFRTAGMWREPLFLAIAFYFFVTAAGGLSLIACCRPDAWRPLLHRSPEAVGLAAAVMVCAIAAPPSAPMVFGFLLPVSVLLCAEWSTALTGRRAWRWIAAGLLVTVVTQHPWTRVDLASSLIDWHPYDVYRGSTSVPADHLWEIWIPRFLFVGIAMWILALAAGRSSTRGERTPVAREEEMFRVPPRAEPGSDAPGAFMRLSVTDTEGPRWGVLSYAYAAGLAALTAYFLFGLPSQLTDSFANLLSIQPGSAWQVFDNELHATAYLRPLLQTQLKIVFELAGTHLFLWFRTVQALQVLIVLWLCVRLLEPRRLADFVIVPCALAMVLGLHTFSGAVREAFPINTFLTLVICCLVAANLARMRGGWIVDVSAAALLAFSLLTLETGVLVWVILVAAYFAGERGVSRRGIALVTTVLAGYFALRLYLHIGSPGFSERSTGFGFDMLDPPQVIARFGSHPTPFYLYNYACALLTVLFAEPRGGVWRFVAGASSGTLQPWQVINVVSSMLTTCLLAWYITPRLRSWIRRDIDRDDYLVFLLVAVLPANALLCVVYVKDVVMSPAGVFYALAAAVALRALVARVPTASAWRLSAGALALVTLMSAGWSWRMLGLHYSLRDRAVVVRSQWAYEDEWEAQNHIHIDRPDAAALKRVLLDDALWRHPAPPHLDERWDPVFDTTQ